MFSFFRLNLFLLILLIPISASVGVADFHWSEIFHSSEQSQIFFISRLPRTLAVILVGATLAVAGMVLQIVLKNRFIEPSMIGTSQSAAIGILLASLLFPTSALLLKMSIATLSALMGMGLFMLLIRQLPPHQQLMLPLIGSFLAMLLKLSALLLLMKLTAYKCFRFGFPAISPVFWQVGMNCSGLPLFWLLWFM